MQEALSILDVKAAYIQVYNSPPTDCKAEVMEGIKYLQFT